MLGLAVSVGAMWGGGLLGAANLLYQDKSISFRDFAFGLIDISRRNFSLGIHLTKETLDYLSPDFHPRNKNTYKLAEEATQALQLKDD